VVGFLRTYRQIYPVSRDRTRHCSAHLVAFDAALVQWRAIAAAIGEATAAATAPPWARPSVPYFGHRFKIGQRDSVFEARVRFMQTGAAA